MWSECLSAPQNCLNHFMQTNQVFQREIAALRTAWYVDTVTLEGETRRLIAGIVKCPFPISFQNSDSRRVCPALSVFCVLFWLHCALVLSRSSNALFVLPLHHKPSEDNLMEAVPAAIFSVQCMNHWRAMQKRIYIIHGIEGARVGGVSRLRSHWMDSGEGDVESVIGCYRCLVLFWLNILTWGFRASNLQDDGATAYFHQSLENHNKDNRWALTFQPDARGVLPQPSRC